MDTRRILKIIDDIQSDEQKFTFQASFQAIFNFYNQNNPTALNNEKDNLFSRLDQAQTSNYVLTDYQILEKLAVNNFFGIYVKQYIDSILSSQAHEVKTKLETFVRERQEALTRLGNLKNSLVLFGITPEILSDNQYEIGFSFPGEYANLDSFENVLGDIKNFLANLADALGEEKIFKIKSVANGSIHLFIEASQNLAKHFDVVIDYSLKIYSAVKAAQDIKSGFQNYSQKRKKALEAEVQAELEEKTKSLIEELSGELDISDSAKKEAVILLFKKMLKHFKKGVSAEVRTPPLNQPQEPVGDASAETRQEFERMKEVFELKKGMDEKNKEIFILQQNNFYGMGTNFLNPPSEEEE